MANNRASTLNNEISIEDLTSKMKHKLIIPPNLTPKVYLKPENIDPLPKKSWNQTISVRLCNKLSFDIGRITQDIRANWNLKSEVIVKLYNHKRNYYQFHVKAKDGFNIVKGGGAW